MPTRFDDEIEATPEVRKAFRDLKWKDYEAEQELRSRRIMCAITLPVLWIGSIAAGDITMVVAMTPIIIASFFWKEK